MEKVPSVIHKDAILANLTATIKLLQECKTAEDAKKALDVGAAAKLWVERQRLGIQAQNSATEFVLHAERILGRILSEGEKHPGGRPGTKPVESKRQVSTLKELGISRDLSSTAQRLAAVPEEEFVSTITEAKKQGQVSHTMIMRQLTRKRTSDMPPQKCEAIEDAVIIPGERENEQIDSASTIISRICEFIDEEILLADNDVRFKVARALSKYAAELARNSKD